MFRSILGFALFALLAILALKLVFAIFAGVMAIAVTLLFWAAIGYVLYVGLRIVSPNTAHRLREMIRGRSA